MGASRTQAFVARRRRRKGDTRFHHAGIDLFLGTEQVDIEKGVNYDRAVIPE